MRKSQLYEVAILPAKAIARLPHDALEAIKAQQITETIQHAMTVNFHRTGIAADKVSARSLRACGAMALLCGKVDMNLIQILGRSHSDTMI
jgi:hypothetical protein